MYSAQSKKESSNIFEMSGYNHSAMSICLAIVDRANFNFAQLKFVRNLIMLSISDSHKAHK